MTQSSPVPERVPPDWGGPLSSADYAAMERSWIDSELADRAMLRRIDEEAGRQIVGQKGNRDCAGILIPYYWPGEARAVNYRIRRDHPDHIAATDGTIKEDRKYLGSPGALNRLYLPPGVTLAHLAEQKLPVVVAEGEKKSLALMRLARYESDQLRFVSVALPGVWNWRGVIGKTAGPKGERLDVKGAIPDLSRIAWNGRTAFILFDRNVHTNTSVAAARKALARHLAQSGAAVKFVDLPDNCGVNGVDDLLASWGPDRVLQLIENAKDGGRLHVVPSPQFESLPTGLYRTIQSGDQLRRTLLTNFNASITGSVVFDDGVETHREFEIESNLFSAKSKFLVPDSQFTTLDWVIREIGPAAIIYPGQRESARAAIQTSAISAAERRIYAHTGWRKLDGGWAFLHSGGALGPAGVVAGEDVRLANALRWYDLIGYEAADLRTAVSRSLHLAGLGPAPVTFPLLAATIRAVFGDADFAMHLAGETGAFKSELAALFQQHFGAGMDRLHLPAAWSSTANSLEVLSFQAKDVLLVIDDFAPHGNAADVARYHSAADRVFRAIGNRAGRGRLDSTANLREAKPPRALILSTGEDIPRGHSVRARSLVLEIGRGEIQSTDLTMCQTDARNALYVTAMSSFIRWLAADYEAFRTAFQKRTQELRLAALQNPAHARTPDIIANLQAAFELYLAFAEDCGSLGHVERDRFASNCWDALRAAGAAQAQHQNVAEPVAMFLTLLRSLLHSGRAHLDGRNGEIPEAPGPCGWRRNGSEWMRSGPCVGWLDGDDIYIESTVAYQEVQSAARSANDSLPVTEATLKRRLKEKGALASTEERRETVTVRRSIAGTTKQVLHFRRPTILPNDPEDREGQVANEA